jgi:catechol 2,3-dioxygenase-like lactoylglutathione lyase family enzyme
MLRRVLSACAFIACGLWAGDKDALVTSVDAIAVTVSDLDRAIEFYTQALTFQKVSETEVAGEAYERAYGIFGVRLRSAKLRLGDEYLELNEYLAPAGRPIPVDSRSNDRWFQHVAIIVSDIDLAYQTLRKFKVRHASPGPQRLPDWNRNAGGISAFYFRDPDGHALEILQFPGGKGNSKWHRTTGKLFLGIDHTAIVISNTESSLRFYRETLGLRIAGESENYGIEQERLNNVFGARLRITALRAAWGPGIELLEYLAPQDGRPYPQDARPNDLLHWHTRVSGAGGDEAALRLQSLRNPVVSSGVVDLPPGETDYRRSLLIRDPDGHAVQFVEN